MRAPKWAAQALIALVWMLRVQVTQVTVLKGFAVTAVYDERFSNLKGNSVPALDGVMRQALMRWRAKPGPQRVVNIYWSFRNTTMGELRETK